MEATQGKPAISIRWNQEAQAVGLEFDKEQIQHWSMVRMLLTEAMQICESQVKMAMLAQMQAQQAQAQQALNMRRNLKLG